MKGGCGCDGPKLGGKSRKGKKSHKSGKSRRVRRNLKRTIKNMTGKVLSWPNHVKKFAAEKGITFPQALKHPDCKKAYHSNK